MKQLNGGFSKIILGRKIVPLIISCSLVFFFFVVVVLYCFSSSIPLLSSPVLFF